MRAYYCPDCRGIVFGADPNEPCRNCDMLALARAALLAQEARRRTETPADIDAWARRIGEEVGRLTD